MNEQDRQQPVFRLDHGPSEPIVRIHLCPGQGLGRCGGPVPIGLPSSVAEVRPFEPDSKAFFPWARQTSVFEVRKLPATKEVSAASRRGGTEHLNDSAFERQSDATYSIWMRSGAARKNSRRQTWNCSIFITPKDSAPSKSPIGMDDLDRACATRCCAFRRWLLDCIRMRLARQNIPGRERL